MPNVTSKINRRAVAVALAIVGSASCNPHIT
jgi:hypothetical protein